MKEVVDSAKNLIQNHPITFGIAGVGVIGSCILLKRQWNNFQERRDLSQKRLKRQQECQKQLKNYEIQFPLTGDALKIVQLPFDDLQKKLADRQLTATQALKAFTAKSVAATKEFNCITEFVPQAQKWAEELDEMSDLKGPLHGIPVCIKENQDIELMDSTAGYSLGLEKPLTKNDPLVQQLLDAGAIPFCKTNVPQTLFSYSSTNPIYGTTVNHLNKKLSPGGSSSGAACLVGAGGAPFATGTDIGGSVRIPAHFSGLASLKPTPGRICSRGATSRTITMAGLTSMYGIIAARVGVVAKIYKVLIGDSAPLKYDALALPIPWNEEVFTSKKKLRIGFLTSLPYFPALGDTPATVLAAKQVLEDLGHTLVPFELPDNWHIMNVFNTLAYSDQRVGHFKRLKNDQVAESGKKFVRGKTFWSWIGETFKWVLGIRSENPDFGNPQGKYTEVLWVYLEYQKRIRYDILSRMANTNVDLILMPAFPFPAPRVQDAEPLIEAVIYTAPWNLCDFPAGVVPFGKESCSNIDGYDDQRNYLFRLAKKGIREAKDMPICVQIVGKPYNEELILRILAELDDYKLRN